MGVASTFGACALLLQFALGGFALARSKFRALSIYGSSCVVHMLTFLLSPNVVADVKDWWIWGYWTSPLMYSVNAILVNEFDGEKWKHVSLCT